MQTEIPNGRVQKKNQLKLSEELEEYIIRVCLTCGVWPEMAIDNVFH